MGDTAENFTTGRHKNAVDGEGGYTAIVHRQDIGLYRQAPEVAWGQYRQVLIAARTGDDGTLDSAASTVWGDWWQHEVVNRGMRNVARFALARVLPLAFPIP